MSDKYGVIRVLAPHQIDVETRWEAAVPPPASGDPHWIGTLKINESTNAVYFFKGPKKPEYDKTSKRWLGINEKSMILAQERPATRDIVAVLEGVNNDHDIFTLLKKNENELPGDLGKVTVQGSHPTPHGTVSTKDSPTLSSTEKAELQNVLEKCVKATLEKYADLVKNPDNRLREVSRMMAITIPSMRFRGFLLVGRADNKLDFAFVSEFYRELQKKMSLEGDPFLAQEEIFEVDVSQFMFINWAKGFAEFLVTDFFDKQEIGFAFLAFEALPKIVLHESSRFLAVNFASWLLPNTTLLFDLYFHMPKNKKFILYLKRGTQISSRILEKFKKRKIETIYIAPTEKQLFLSYCIKMKLDIGIQALKQPESQPQEKLS